MRRRHPRLHLGWIASAAALAAVLAGVLVAGLTPTLPEAPVSKHVPGRSGTAAQPTPIPSSTMPLTAAGGRQAATLRLWPPYEVADAVTILTETHRIRLAGLEGPASEAACYDPAQRLWACGLQARAALNNLIRGQTLLCRDTGLKAGEASIAHCSLGREPLDRAMVRQGYARPLTVDGPLAPDLLEARVQKRGLWNGDWRVRP